MVDRWEVLQLVKDVARSLDIGEREIAVLSAHLTVFPKGPIRSDRLLISYAEIGGILDRANCMDERRFRRGETRLEELGLLTRKLSANGRRFPIRDAAGRVVDAYGVDLRPLFLKLETLRALQARQVEEERRRNALRCRISAAVSAVKRQALARFGAVPQGLLELAQDIRNLLRRTAVTLAEMRSAEQRLTAAAEAILRDGEDASEASPAPATTRDQGADTPLPDSSSVDAGQMDRHIESPEKEDPKPCPKSAAMSDRKLWRACPNLVEFYPDPPGSEHELVRRIVEFSGFLGLGQPLATTALHTLGWQKCLLVIDYLAGRIHALDRPQAYLKAMLRRYEANETVAGGRVGKRLPLPV